MSTLKILALITAAVTSTGIASPHSRRAESWTFEESKTRSESIPLEGARRVVVDNFHGSIRVGGHAGSIVTMSVTEILRARDAAAAEIARREVQLRVFRDGEKIVICADGPFRAPGNCTEWRQHNWRSDGWDYDVIYEIEIQVPRDVDLEARTIDGDVEVTGVKGEFEVGGVNGSVALSGMRGSGEARSVNGSVKVFFEENPSGDCAFSTINGNIEISFQQGLSADLSLKTMNGEVLTDFDYQMLPATPVRIEEAEGGTKFRLEAGSRIRVASGGPRFEFENLNGNILVRRSR